MANDEQRVYTQAEIEAVEIAEAVTEFLLGNYSEYPHTTVLAATMIVTNSLMRAIQEKQQEIEKNESDS